MKKINCPTFKPIPNQNQILKTVLTLKDDDMDVQEHCNKMWEYLQSSGVNSHRSGIVTAVAAKANVWWGFLSNPPHFVFVFVFVVGLYLVLIFVLICSVCFLPSIYLSIFPARKPVIFIFLPSFPLFFLLLSPPTTQTQPLTLTLNKDAQPVRKLQGSGGEQR